VELVLSLSPIEAYFVRCVAVIFSVMDSLDGREAFTSYHVLRMTASDRFSNDLVSVLRRYLSVLQLFLLMVYLVLAVKFGNKFHNTTGHEGPERE
jgi:hypothetical protein